MKGSPADPLDMSLPGSGSDDQAQPLRRLRRLAEEQAALRRVATLVASNPEPSEVFASVCAEVASVLGVKSTNLTRFEDDRTQTILAGWSLPGAPVFPTRGGVPLDSDAAVTKVARSGRAARVDDYSPLTGRLPAMIRAAGIASAVAVPITVGGELWGAVVASSGTPNGFPPDTEKRMAGFAVLVADALASADAREKLAASRARIVEVGDAERRRLERNLHDGAQQRLVSLALLLRELEASLELRPERAKELAGQARDELALALDELRELARGIHPAVLSDRGLQMAVETLVSRAPVPVEVDPLPRERLPAPVEAAAYYLVAEALTNVAKHADATRARVRITRELGSVQVEVSDDGQGGAEVGQGLGLRGLADRVEVLGGSLAVYSIENAGTTLSSDIPLE